MMPAHLTHHGGEILRVLVTGSASRLAATLLPQLAADDRIEQIIGVDLRTTAFRDPRYTQVLLDTRSAELVTVLKGTDAVVHLAMVAHPQGTQPEPRDRGTMHTINVVGTQNVAQLAHAQGVRRFVFVSSPAVYELPPRARVISESHPRQAWPGIGYADDCVEVEAWLDDFDQDRANFTVVRLRPHFIIGRNTRPFVRGIIAAPFYIPLTDRPRLQCVHEDDVAQAIIAALYQDARGAFNLACADSATLEEIKRMQHRLLVPLAFPLARGLLRLATRVGVNAEPAWIEALRYNLILDTTRARKQLRWRPRYDSVMACIGAGKAGPGG